MNWNYRVLEFAEPETGEPWQAIHEVYYDDDGQPNGYAEDAAIVMSEEDGDGEPMGLAWVLQKMSEALQKPVLREIDFRRTPATAGEKP